MSECIYLVSTLRDRHKDALSHLMAYGIQNKNYTSDVFQRQDGHI